MNRAKNTAKDVLCLTICILSLAAIFHFESIFYNHIATTIAILTVTFFSRNQRQNLPILLCVICVQLIEFTVNMSLSAMRMHLLQLTLASLLDLLLAFFIVHYHKDRTLFRWCRVPEPARSVPQVYLLSVFLACSSLFSFLLAGEIMLFYVDENFFQGQVPFFHSISGPVKLTLKVLFDLAIWSLLLDPARWWFLRKIEQRFDL